MLLIEHRVEFFSSLAAKSSTRGTARSTVAMAQNASDSSDDDGASFTTTNVMLGYASNEPTDDSFSQLGGYPVRASPFLANSILAET